jgi:hypothetical protein
MAENRHTVDIDISCDVDPAIKAIDRLKKKIGLVWLIMAIARWVALHTPWIVATALLAVGVIGGWPWAIVTTFTVTADAAVRMGRWPGNEEDKQGGRGAKLREAIRINSDLHRTLARTEAERDRYRAAARVAGNAASDAVTETDLLRDMLAAMQPEPTAPEASTDPQP